MTNNTPRRIALKTLIKHKHYSLNHYTDIQRIVESYQFTMIEYKKHANSKPVSELVKKLKIEREIEQNDAFLYINNSLKFVFINADLSDEDKCSLLRHELGHICDPDFINHDVCYSKIKKEEFANQFSCCMKNPGICFRIYIGLLKKWKLLVSLMAFITFVAGLPFLVHTLIPPAKPVAGNAYPAVIPDSTYFVTSSGKKYHRENCIIIKYKNNLTEIKLNDAIDKGYQPCLICNLEEE